VEPLLLATPAYPPSTAPPYPQAQHPSAPLTGGQAPPTVPGMNDMQRKFFEDLVFLLFRWFSIALSRCIHATILSNATWL